jgi:Ca2+/Na+ antiporter
MIEAATILLFASITPSLLILQQSLGIAETACIFFMSVCCSYYINLMINLEDRQRERKTLEILHKLVKKDAASPWSSMEESSDTDDCSQNADPTVDDQDEVKSDRDEDKSDRDEDKSDREQAEESQDSSVENWPRENVPESDTEELQFLEVDTQCLFDDENESETDDQEKDKVAQLNVENNQ